MAQNPNSICATLASRFIYTLYDGVTGMPVKPGLIATEAGARALRQAIDSLRTLDMQKQRSLRDVEFELEKVRAPSQPDTVMRVTVVERYSATYEAPNPRDNDVHGRRRHHFVMIVNDTGKVQVDAYSCVQLSETRGKARIKKRTFDETVTMSRPPPPSSASGGRGKRRSRRYSFRFRLWNEGTRKLSLVLFGLVVIGIAYLIFFGAHHREVAVCLYTGARREAAGVMNYQLYDRMRATGVSNWVIGWIDPPAKTEDGHYWVPYSGWRKEFAESRVKVAPSVETEVAMETLRLIHWFSVRDGQRAIEYVKRYHRMIDRLVLILEEAEGAEDWELLRQEFLIMQNDLKKTVE